MSDDNEKTQDGETIESLEELITTHQEVMTENERREFETRVLGEMVRRVLIERETIDPNGILNLLAAGHEEDLGQWVLSEMFAQNLILRDDVPPQETDNE